MRRRAAFTWPRLSLARVGPSQHARLQGGGQARGAHVEAQLGGVGHLVDVLTAGTLRPNRLPLQVGRVERVGNAGHDASLMEAPCG